MTDETTVVRGALPGGEGCNQRARSALKETACGDDDTDVQLNALFALTQMEGGGGLDEPVATAEKHPNPAIRKEGDLPAGPEPRPEAA